MKPDAIWSAFGWVLSIGPATLQPCHELALGPMVRITGGHCNCAAGICFWAVVFMAAKAVLVDRLFPSVGHRPDLLRCHVQTTTGIGSASFMDDDWSQSVRHIQCRDDVDVERAP